MAETSSVLAYSVSFAGDFMKTRIWAPEGSPVLVICIQAISVLVDL